MLWAKKGNASSSLLTLESGRLLMLPCTNWRFSLGAVPAWHYQALWPYSASGHSRANRNSNLKGWIEKLSRCVLDNLVGCRFIIKNRLEQNLILNAAFFGNLFIFFSIISAVWLMVDLPNRFTEQIHRANWTNRPTKHTHRTDWLSDWVDRLDLSRPTLAATWPEHWWLI